MLFEASQEEEASDIDRSLLHFEASGLQNLMLQLVAIGPSECEGFSVVAEAFTCWWIGSSDSRLHNMKIIDLHCSLNLSAARSTRGGPAMAESPATSTSPEEWSANWGGAGAPFVPKLTKARHCGPAQGPAQGTKSQTGPVKSPWPNRYKSQTRSKVEGASEKH